MKSPYPLFLPSINGIRLRRITPAVVFFCVLCLIWAATRMSRAGSIYLPSSSQKGTKDSKLPAVPGELLVRFKSGSSEIIKNSVKATAVRDAQGEIHLSVEPLEAQELIPGLRLARVAPEETARALAALNMREDVLYAEPNYLMSAAATPNDPRYSEMYALNNNGQTGGLPGADIDAELAWNITTGSSDVVVGVIDSGIDINHQDLQPNIWTNSSEVPNNNLDDDQNGYVDDVNGWDFYNGDKTVYDSSAIDTHGTHIAGIIGAAGNNGLGVVGVNWNVKIMPLKFLGTTGGSGPTSAAIAAINYAIQMRSKGVKIRVLNASWGGPGRSQALVDALVSLHNAGILFVTAAGNEGTDNFTFPTYPANLDNLPRSYFGTAVATPTFFR